MGEVHRWAIIVPYDIHLLIGTKLYAEDAERLLHLVRCKWPGAMREGSCGTMSFTSGDMLVAEAWMHRTRTGWWYRIRSKCTL